MGDSGRGNSSSLFVYDRQANDDLPASNVQDDEQLARDIQMALELQDQEDRLATEFAGGGGGELSRVAGDDPHGSSGYPLNDWNRLDHMLFVACEVEGRLVEMLVDSGASSSCISFAMVQYLQLERHFNRGVRGEATGAGKAQIVGILENVSCQIGHVEFRLFFLVLDTQRPYLILGLDQMRRFSCVIDLENNNLLFGGRDGVSTPFLSRELAHEAALRPLPPEALPTAVARARRPGDSDGTFSIASRFSSLFGRR
jgi:Aspartyl protease